MKNKRIHIIRPVENAAEKEYIKEFFRFIGCFISDWVVDINIEQDWGEHLQSCNEAGGIDIVLNYFGNDPYAEECKQQNIKRIYCYLDFGKRTYHMSDVALISKSNVPTVATKVLLRTQMLSDLISAIWESDPISQAIQDIAAVYVGNQQGDLFYLLQAKRSLRVLGMGEVLKEPSAMVTHLPFVPYLNTLLRGLWQVQVSLSGRTDPYSVYARINAASMTREVVTRLYGSEHRQLEAIEFEGVPFRTIPLRDLVIEIQNQIKSNPQFVSTYLLLACLCKSSSVLEQNEERCYIQMLQALHNGKHGYNRGCAFILYRIGYFYEKKYCDTDLALQYYTQAVEADPNFYQALFKLGYYAATDGQFSEAEMWLKRMINAIFNGRSTEPNENGEYENWLTLSLKDSQYVYKAYILLAKIAINSNREYSIKSYIGKACLAATKFEEASLIRHASEPYEGDYNNFMAYHSTSVPVWAMWQVLRPWSEDVIHDFFVRDVVRSHLSRWKEI